MAGAGGVSDGVTPGGIAGRGIAHCRSEKVRLEPPTFGQISRLVGSALRMFEERFCRTVEQRLDAVDGVVPRLEQVAGQGADCESAAGGGERFLYELKTDPGVLGTETFRQEIVKLGRVKAMRLPTDLLSGDGETGHGLAGPGGRCFPSDLANRRAGPADVVGGVVPGPNHRDHRRLGRVVDPAGTEDRHEGRAEGRERIDRRSETVTGKTGSCSGSPRPRWHIRTRRCGG